MAGVSNYVTVSRRPPDIEDYIDMARRYRSWIIGPMFAGLVISVVVAFLWQDTFVSTAVMQITPQQISARLVPTDYTTQMADMLNQMQQEILSRSSLTELITRQSLDLYAKERLKRPLDDIVQDMRNRAIRIQMIDLPVSARLQNGQMPATAFTISFTYIDRFKAQQVVRELVTKFVDQNVKLHTDQARATTNFIQDELGKAKKDLDDASARLTKWKLGNQGKLPEQFQSNWTAMQGAEMELQRLSDNRGHAQSQKLMLEQQIRNMNAEQEYLAQNAESVIMSPGQMSVKNQQIVNLSDRLVQTRMMMAQAKKQYGEKYPAIAELQAQIDTLEQQKAELEKEQAEKDAEAASAKPSETKVANPQVQQRMVEIKNNTNILKTQLATTQQEIDAIGRSEVEVNKRIAAYQERLNSEPIGQAEYQALLRDYDNAQQAYNGQVKKKEESETQQNLEEHKIGQQLMPLDPPNLPESPVEPNRPIWAAAGTAIGLMIGIVLAAVKEMKDASLKNLKDVRAYTNLPVLSSVPLLENALLVRRKRRLFWLAWSASFIFGTLAMSASMYYHFFGRS